MLGCSFLQQASGEPHRLRLTAQCPLHSLSRKEETKRQNTQEERIKLRTPQRETMITAFQLTDKPQFILYLETCIHTH